MVVISELLHSKHEDKIVVICSSRIQGEEEYRTKIFQAIDRLGYMI